MNSKQSLSQEFSNMATKDLVVKRNELYKEIVKFNVSLDPAVISGGLNVISLKKHVKLINRELKKKLTNTTRI